MTQYGDIYVVQLDSCIKVGFTTNLPARLRAYRTSNVTVKPLYGCVGTIEQEKEFHRIFNGGKEKYFCKPEEVIQGLRQFNSKENNNANYRRN